MEDAKRWHYVLQADKRGPVSLDVLRELIAAGTVQRGTHVWCEGMSTWRPADSVDDLRQFFATAPAAPVMAPTVIEDNAVSTIIPYKNAPALIGYYVSIASLIPLLGALLSIAAIVLGFVGLSNVRKRPEVKGTAHAIIAISLGAIVLLAHIAGVVLFLSNRF
ncbi:MAG TPA: GYF domain-containing protein [Phycisphaerales bacterium]|nr:GYF domain-containing protein [Phycisphaerales bacterium]